MTSHIKAQKFLDELAVVVQNAGENADLVIMFTNKYTTKKHKGNEVEFLTDIHADNNTVFLHLKPINEPEEP